VLDHPQKLINARQTKTAQGEIMMSKFGLTYMNTRFKFNNRRYIVTGKTIYIPVANSGYTVILLEYCKTEIETIGIL
jgi:hypothetical protein